jgi:hypothetical protein
MPELKAGNNDFMRIVHVYNLLPGDWFFRFPTVTPGDV